MSNHLGRVEDLPPDYFNGLVARNLMPLWPSLRAALPYGIPSRNTRPMAWKYADIRPELMRAGELTPIEKAERRGPLKGDRELVKGKRVIVIQSKARRLGMGLIGVLAGASVSVRQILLHIKPVDSGYGEPLLGLHLYTWAFVTFAIVMIYVGVMLMLMPRGIPQAPAAGSTAWKISSAIIWLFVGVVAANVIAIIFLEGFAPVLPDDPAGYNLIDQLTGR
jgi:hypothetical protein